MNTLSKDNKKQMTIHRPRTLGNGKPSHVKTYNDTASRWTNDDAKTLCGNCTDRDLLSDPSNRLDNRVDVATNSGKFCLDAVILHAKLIHTLNHY